jgi:hypothetical protein
MEYGGSVEITAIIDIYQVSDSVCFPSEGQIIPPRTLKLIKLWFSEVGFCFLNADIEIIIVMGVGIYWVSIFKKVCFS